MSISVTTLTSAYSSGLSTTTASSISELSDNYDMFVELLTTQLENQNPLDPTDTDELTQQILSYSMVEQQILTNEYMESLVLSTSNEASSVALAFVGMEVTYDSSEQTLSGSSLTWSLDIPDDVSEITYEVENEDGLTVYETTEDSPDSGDTTFTWDGTSTSNSITDGDDYTLVATVTYSDGTSEELDLQSTSVVTEVSWSTGSPVLVMENGSTTSLSSIISATAVEEEDTTES